MIAVSAANPDEQSSRPPLFDGTRANFIAWVITFSGWIAWRITDAAGIADGSDTRIDLMNHEPDPVAEPVDHVTWTTRSEKWHASNRKLYGAIIQAVPEWLRTSIYHDHRNDGATALDYLHRTFDANDANDNAAHVARLGAHYIDAKADINEDDLRLQYDSMMVARAGILRTGNTPPDDHTLIAMYDNSLPISYTQIRQLVRRSNHATLSHHYNDYMGQVRAELSARAPALGAYMTLPGGGGRGNPTGRGGRPGARGGGPRGGGGGRGGSEPSSNPCLRCGRPGHSRRDCTQPKTTCRHCNADHRASFCPKGPGSVYRDALTDGAKAILDRDVANSTGAALPANPSGATNPHANAAGATNPAAQTPPPSHPSEIPIEAHAAAAAAASSQTEPLRAAEAYSSALRSLGYGMMVSAMSAPPVPTSLHPPAGCRLVSALVDSMATFWIVPDASYLHRITNHSPGFSINTANGPVPVLAVGVASIRILAANHSWHRFEVPNVLVLPSCPSVLYSTRVMNTLFKIRHDTDSLTITLPSSHTVPILDDGSSYYIPIAFEPRASPSCRSSHTRHPVPAAHAALLLSAFSVFPAGVSGTPQATLYHRLGFPPAGQWRHVPTTVDGHGLPPNTVPSTTIPVRDAVLRGRARAAPFNASAPLAAQPPPGAVFYMDFAGPLTKSFLHGYLYYCGVVDAGSGYGRVFPCHGPTAIVASTSLSAFTADVAAKMRLTSTFKPTVVSPPRCASPRHVQADRGSNRPRFGLCIPPLP